MHPTLRKQSQHKCAIVNVKHVKESTFPLYSHVEQKDIQKQRRKSAEKRQN